MSKTEEKNVKKYLSIVNALYLEKMYKAEEQMNEILQQIKIVNDKIDNIEQGTEEFKVHEKNEIQKKVENISEEIAKLNNYYPKYKDNDVVSNINKKVLKQYKAKKNNKKIAVISEIVFYILIIAMALGAFWIHNNKSGEPISIAGYSFFTVLTGSMESEIPQGSLVISKKVDEKNLKVGDDITFKANQNTIITHRIITIIEDYQNTGMRAFETQGVMNEKPDKNLVKEANVIGKVVYHNKLLGQTLKYIGENWMFIIFVLIIICVFISFLERILKDDND